MARRWREADEPDDDVPYGPTSGAPPGAVVEGSG
jgi:hypothetical protein